MKSIGLIGGMSWESTVVYYQLINRSVSEKLGGLHSAKVILESVDFADIEKLQASGDWQQAGEILAQIAVRLENAGADFVVLCTNTMHKVTEQIEQALSIPFLHIADATGEELKRNNFQQVALLGTRFTMEQDFYRKRLEQRFGLEVLIPNQLQCETVHNIIYNELCHGQIKSKSRQRYLEVIDDLTQQGAQAVILGCTEIGLLVEQVHTDVPLIDTTQVHAEAAVKFAIS